MFCRIQAIRWKGRLDMAIGGNSFMSDSELAVVAAQSFPAPILIERAGPSTRKKFFEFFTVPIRNAHTRAAYYRAIQQFLAWAERAGYQDLEDIEPITVAAYIEILQRQAAPATIKQHMAAIRMMFSWLTEKGVLAMNPAREVKTERFSRTEGKTPAFVETAAIVGTALTDNVAPSEVDFRRIIREDIGLGAHRLIKHIAFAFLGRQYDPVPRGPVVITGLPLDIQKPPAVCPHNVHPRQVLDNSPPNSTLLRFRVDLTEESKAGRRQKQHEGAASPLAHYVHRIEKKPTRPGSSRCSSVNAILSGLRKDVLVIN
jgi:hypothetical protein